MKNNLKSGMRMYSNDLDCIHVLITVTEKRVSYTPEIPNSGLVSNKNRIRVFTTSLRKASEWVNSGSWTIQN